MPSAIDSKNQCKSHPLLKVVVEAMPRLQKMLAGQPHELATLGIMLRATNVLLDGKSKPTPQHVARFEAATKRAAVRRKKAATRVVVEKPAGETKPRMEVKKEPTYADMAKKAPSTTNPNPDRTPTRTQKRREARTKTTKFEISYAPAGIAETDPAKAEPLIDKIASIQDKIKLTKSAQGFRQPTIKDARALVSSAKAVVKSHLALLRLVVDGQQVVVDPTHPMKWPWLAVAARHLDLTPDVLKGVSEAAKVLCVSRGLILASQKQQVPAARKSKSTKTATLVTHQQTESSSPTKPETSGGWVEVAPRPKRKLPKPTKPLTLAEIVTLETAPLPSFPAASDACEALWEDDLTRSPWQWTPPTWQKRSRDPHRRERGSHPSSNNTSGG